MTIREFTTPLAIEKCKLGDTLIFATNEITPYDFQLTINDIDGNALYGPVSADLTRDDVQYWFVTANAAHGISSALTYYEATISDGETNAYPDERYIFYVTDDVTFENYIVRSLGLAGHNCRRFDHVWSRGLLTAFEVKFYATVAALNAAIAGTSDDYIAHYAITIRYNENYNRISLTSVKQ